jgi:hypothetical protein
LTSQKLRQRKAVRKKSKMMIVPKATKRWTSILAGFSSGGKRTGRQFSCKVVWQLNGFDDL